MMFSDQISLSCQVPPWTIEYWKHLTFPTVNPNYYLISSTGKIFSLISNRYLKLRIDPDGYQLVVLARINQRPASFRVHRLVAYNFCNPPENFNDLQVNHIDCNKENNFDVNLEFVSCQENMQHAIFHELYKYGEHQGHSKLTNEEVHKICKLLQDTNLNSLQIKDILNINHISNTSFIKIVSQIKNHRTWNCISSQYNF